MHRYNHYIPRSYLKQWSHDGSTVWAYRILVSHARVRLWRKVSTRGVAYHEHLYTRIVASGESDEIERWLDTQFEAPAEPVIGKVVSGRPLSPSDWKVLIRFFAAQDVRTPARLVENLSRWSKTLPDMIQKTLAESVAEFEAMTIVERAELRDKLRSHGDIPFRVSVEQNTSEGGGWLKAETVSGRKLWLWSMQQVLTTTLRALYKHRWTILAPPDGMTWFTSDDPVVKLNFNTVNDYTFGGGWGSVGTDLLLPLGPHHLLFTQIGRRVPPRGSRMELDKAVLVRKLIAEHAHRYIFASAPDPFVHEVRPRAVDAKILKHESREWKIWHADQGAAERSLIGNKALDFKSPNESGS